ncbi:MAG: glycosyltransferase family 1 protein [Patescibacteria group bacterium]
MVVAIDASRAELKEKTGVEYYSYYLIKHLMLVIPADTKVILYSRVSLKSVFDNLPLNWENKVLVWPLKFFWTQLRLYWQAIKDHPDVLFIPSHVSPFLYDGPVVTTIHDISWKKTPEAYSWTSKLFLNLANIWMAKKSSAIITVSEYSKSELQKYYPTLADKIIITYLGPTLPVNDELTTQALGQFFLILGRVESKKNISIVIKAFAGFLKQNPNLAYKLILIGRPGVGAGKIFKQIEEFNLKNNVINLGWQPSKIVSQYLKKATALLFPGAYEGFGLPILDAWNHGVPVIAASTGALPEVVGEAGLLAKFDDINGWQTYLNILFANEKVRQNLITRGFDRLKLFTWHRTAVSTWQVLNLVATKTNLNIPTISNYDLIED